MDSTEPEDNKHFIIRHRIKLIVALVALAAIAALLMSGREKRPIRKAQPERMVSIAMPAPLPPPPPRPPEQRPPEPTPSTPDEMVVQEPVEAAPDEAPPEAPSAEPDNAPGPAGEAMGTNIEGDGTANGWGLSGKGGGGIIGGGGGGGGIGRGGSRWGWYTGSHMRSRIENALQEHEKTRSASLDINVRLWVDNTGRISHAQLVGSTGDPELDAALRDGVLTGLAMREPPPADMPQPILMRITGLRPE